MKFCLFKYGASIHDYNSSKSFYCQLKTFSADKYAIALCQLQNILVSA
ncbi:MAG: hypothetical protein OFPI_36270 [Osedax symbiont Rs2]|nr:MAG: hypothetical protein OFPI_36270 [Osedax symbiont Rs2]